MAFLLWKLQAPLIRAQILVLLYFVYLLPIDSQAAFLSSVPNAHKGLSQQKAIGHAWYTQSYKAAAPSHLALRGTTVMAAATTTAPVVIGTNATDSSGLLQAKLHVLEDIVVKLNSTKNEDQKQLEVLQSRIQKSEQELKQQKSILGKELELQESELNKLEAQWKEQRDQDQKRHDQELQNVERKLLAKAKSERDEIEQRIRKETNQWKSEREREWNESFEIATASVAAAEKREQELHDKLEEIEKSYQQEAAEYKRDLDQLRQEWNLENTRLKEQVERSQSEVVEMTKAKDQEFNLVVGKLEREKNQLQVDLQLAREQVQIQRARYKNEHDDALLRWKEQRDKERKFYTETIRLLQQERSERENNGFRKRLKRFAGRLPFKRAKRGPVV